MPEVIQETDEEIDKREREWDELSDDADGDEGVCFHGVSWDEECEDCEAEEEAE